MLKTLGAQVGEFRKDSLLTPVFMILEVLMETMIPLMMASIIDDGVNAENIRHIYIMGLWMVAAAFVSLFAGAMGGKFGARASTGFARNLRTAMFENIQTFSFSNIDRFSTAGLVTRLTTDVTNLQNAYQMLLRMCVRAPISLVCAMGMAFFISPRLACIYLAAVFFLGIILAVITVKAHGYFMQVFPKYDDLNASVQENVSAIRIVKACVREDYEKEKQKDLEKPKKDISSNNDISVKVHSQKNSEDYEESQADSSYNTLDELIKCVENVVAGRLSTNMIGVFGMNSDIVVNNLCHSLQNIRDNINFVGGIEYSDSFSDIYNSIAAIFLDYISSNFDRDYGMDYYIREVLLELEKVYDDFQDDYKYESSFQALSKINRRSERSRNMLSAINRIKQIKNTLS